LNTEPSPSASNGGYDREYDRCISLFAGLDHAVYELLNRLLHSENLRAHSVTFRTKSKDSTRRKLLTRPDGAGLGPCDLHDFLGLRVITYFADTVDQVGQLIEREFSIDRANSVDKRAALDPDRFGYMSLHYVASMSNARVQLAEYRQFSGLQFEVQIRSILQHAWAEIEHDLGYKSEKGIPRQVRRRFSALAGLLEIGDSQFIDLRTELADYQVDVERDIQQGVGGIPIDQESIVAFIRSEPMVLAVDEAISGATNVPLMEDTTFSAGSASSDLPLLGLETITEVTNSLKTHQKLIAQFAADFLNTVTPGHEPGTFPRGISLFYLAYFIAAEKGPEKVRELLRSRRSRDSDLEHRVLASYRKVAGQGGR
jgi:ppGpp synthetase/RelA/SpoT-type nucleotidyltranferase